MLDVDHIASDDGSSSPSPEALRVTCALRELREEHRLKEGTDFAMTYKYGERHVLCTSVFEDSLREVLAKHGVPVATWHTYGP